MRRVPFDVALMGLTLAINLVVLLGDVFDVWPR